MIGAGISGLGAANTLKEKGYHNVKVLESRDRVGGRISTKKLGDGVIDIGASWIHGIGPGAVDLPLWENKHNPIYELVKKHKIETIKCYDDIEESEEKFYWYKGGEMPK